MGASDIDVYCVTSISYCIISFRIYISCSFVSFSHCQQTNFSKCYSDVQSTKHLGRCCATNLNLSRTEIPVISSRTQWWGRFKPKRSTYDIISLICHISHLIIYISFPTSPFLHTNWPGKNKIGLLSSLKTIFLMPHFKLAAIIGC